MCIKVFNQRKNFSAEQYEHEITTEIVHVFENKVLVVLRNL